MDRDKAVKLAEIRVQECIAVRVRLINRVITNIYDRALRPYGIKVNQVSILTIISLSEGLKPNDICRMLYMEKSTVSRNIERMRKKGWLNVTQGTDGISQILIVTPEGNKLLKDIHKDWVKAQNKATDFIGSREIQIIKQLADNIWSSRKRGS